MEKVLWLIKCVKVVCKVPAGDFSLDNASWLDRPAEVDSNQINILTETIQCYTMQVIVDILKLSKSSFENHFH